MDNANEYLQVLVNECPASEAIDLIGELLLEYLKENGKENFLALISPLAKDKEFSSLVKEIAKDA